MKNITIGQYKNLLDVTEYKILENLNPVNEFNNVVFNPERLTYRDMCSLVKLLKTGNDWDSLYNIFKIMYGVDETDFYRCNIVEFYACRNYIFDYVMKMQKRESKLLQSISADTELWRSAGGDRLNKFSNIMPLVQLGELFGVYPFDLEDKYYNQIIVLLVALKERGEVQQAFSKLKHKVKR